MTDPKTTEILIIGSGAAAHIATKLAVRAARVSGFFAARTR
jgi:hypothetical protein